MRAFLIFALWVSMGVSAQAQSADDRGAVQTVIERQIDAFKSDDAGRAFAMAAPSIKQLFQSQDLFMDMVRKGYRPVYRPQSYRFEDLQTDGSSLKQSLGIVDPDGVEWLAEYTLERQGDGQWLISGCVLIRRTTTTSLL
jgi:hypothetical protein